MTKQIKILTFLLLTLCASFLQAAEELKAQPKPMLIIAFDKRIDETVEKFPAIDQAFTLLQNKGLINMSFQQFLQKKLIHNDDEINEQDMSLNCVIAQAKNLITETILDTKTNININFKNFIDPIFNFVIQHKDGFMQDVVRDWLHEWSKFKDIEGRTLLHIAAENNCPEKMHLLINAGANLNLQEDMSGRTPLHLAILNNDLESVRILIEAGANLNLQCHNGWNSLHTATCMNFPEIACMLLDKSSNLNIRNAYGRTPEQEARTPEMLALFVQARQKNEAQSMTILESQLKKIGDRS